MQLNFKISNFNISGKPIPEQIADKILFNHILPMQKVRDVLDIKMWASEKSGYRSVSWERSHGRTGSSQHTFKGMGAVDWTCEDFGNNRAKFLEAIIKHTNYTRMAMYNGFIHCDYKKTNTGQREVFVSDKNSNWEFLKFAG